MPRIGLALAASVALLAAALLAADPPGPDDDVGFLNKKAKTVPATGPSSLPSATQPVFKPNQEDGKRPGMVTLSDGEKVRGRLSTTPDKPVRIFDPAAKEYRDIPFELIKSMEAKVLWEREEKEWHFRESGSDIKEFTGRSYPARETEYTVTLLNGQTITGSTSAPIFVTALGADDKLLILHKRDKGPVGKTLKDLVYVKRIDFTDVENKEPK